MPSFESKVTRLSDTGAPRFLVEFIGEMGENIAIEYKLPDAVDEEPSREEIVEAARRLAGDLAAPGRNPNTNASTYASGARGLSRAPEETEARTHTSDGRDQGDF